MQSMKEFNLYTVLEDLPWHCPGYSWIYLFLLILSIFYFGSSQWAPGHHYWNHSPIYVTCNMQMDIFCSMYFIDVGYFMCFIFSVISGCPYWILVAPFMLSFRLPLRGGPELNFYSMHTTCCLQFYMGAKFDFWGERVSFVPPFYEVCGQNKIFMACKLSVISNSICVKNKAKIGQRMQKLTFSSFYGGMGTKINFLWDVSSLLFPTLYVCKIWLKLVKGCKSWPFPPF